MANARTRRSVRKIPNNLPQWPIDKPLPKFRSWAEEDRFWRSWSFANMMDAYGVEVPQRNIISHVDYSMKKKRRTYATGW